MKKSLIFISAFFLIGCSTNNQNVQIEDSDEIAVCGEVAGEKQTYPTLGDLKNDGAKLLYYGPCNMD